MSRRVDDRSAWMGKEGHEMPTPKESKIKTEQGVHGAGGMADYPDTYEKIKHAQEGAVRKIHGHKQPSDERY